MRSSERSRALLRAARYEVFEERLALSAQPLDDFALHLGPQLEHHYGELTPLEQIESLSPVGDFQTDAGLQWRVSTQASTSSTQNAAHQLTGVNYVYNTFGFDGGGQTVAVIDSGIAWDHVDLGGGYGTNFRVVGGYDFAENDSNPYDDGPSGFHGTHVAGIIGNSDSTYRGVASGVDLVGLRVFDDNGAGYFSWVEQALRWVHQNRNAFRNPITTVNLSLGTSWNANTVPNWSTIEDEFQQLKADGIFIAVSAGNSFADYKKAGLSYPASSPYVVPVASVDNDGLLSDFSQRNSRVIAAPGRSIVSTVPDHVFGADGVKDDFAAASGTSMAAPYAAGASALVRQAMEFIGRTNITEDTIYTHLRNTADTIYDAVTKANYFRMNVRRAIESLMPTDDYGSTVTTAKSLGTLSNNATFKGVIGTLADNDYFTFTAANSGRLSFQYNTTHDLELNAQVVGGSATFQGNTLSLDVVAGQKYSFSLSTKDGIGHYAASVSLDSGPTKLGAVSFQVLENQSTGATTWYELTAARSGKLSVESLFHHASGNVDLELYNDAKQLLGLSKSSSNSERVDLTVTQGQKLFIKLVGANQDVDLRVTNLVAQVGTTLNVFGTANVDQYSLAASSNLTLTVNGTTYTFASTAIQTVNFQGGAGQDILRTSGSSTNLTVNRNDVLTVAELATALDRDLELAEGAGKATNWGGLGEKWLKGNNNTLYFITPNGKLYRWTGTNNQNLLSKSTFVAELDASYFTTPSKLFNASGTTNSGGNTSNGGSSGNSSTANDVARRAYNLDQAKNLKLDGGDHKNWGGKNEKWLKGNDGWYFILSDGKVYKWNGKAGANGTLVETLDASYYNDLSKLYNAQAPSNSNSGSSNSGSNNSGNSSSSAAASLARRAYDLDQAKNLQFDGKDYLNWGGKNEKWLKGNDGWYFILSDGKVCKWDGKPGANGSLAATLDNSYYNDLSKLYDAKLPPTAATSSVVAVSSDRGVDADFLPQNDTYIVTLASAQVMQESRTDAVDRLFATTGAADEDDHATSSRPVPSAVRAAYFIQYGHVPVRVAIAASQLKPTRLDQHDELGTLDSVFDDLGCENDVTAWSS